MSLDENKAIVRKWIEACNTRNLSLLDELIAPSFFHPTWKLRGAEGYKQFYTMFLKGFTDCQEHLKDVIAEGDKVWHRFKTTGTHTGEFEFGKITLAPTGKKFTMMGVNFWRIVDGKVVEKEGVYDQLDFFKQIGVIDYTEKAKHLFPEDVSSQRILSKRENRTIEKRCSMSLDENKAIVRLVYESLNTQDLSSLDNLLAPNFFIHTYQIYGLEKFKQYYMRLYGGFPDWHETIEDIIAEGDKVWVCLTDTGTHRGEYRGIAPNGKKHVVKGVAIYRIVAGKVVEGRLIEDTLDSLKQLGVIEYTEKAKTLFSGKYA